MDNMTDYSYWKVEWKRNGFVGVTDGQNHVVFTDREWNEILLEREFEKEWDKYPYE